MAVTGAPIEVLGLKAWVTALKGPAFRDVNAALRNEAFTISKSLVPEVEHAVGLSKAPQAKAMVKTVRPKRDRVPVLAVGAVNPKFTKKSGKQPPFTRRGSGATAHRRRRGAIAHGVIYGTKGGHLKGGGDYYHIGRDESGGAFGRYISSGPAFDAACEAYFDAYKRVLRRAGVDLNGRFRKSSVQGRMAA